MVLYAVGALPEAALSAAARFYAKELPAIAKRLADGGDDLVLVFAPADHSHRGWRLAAVQELARAQAPRRVNAVASDDKAAITAAANWLAAAPGVTGQYLPLDGNGALGVLSQAG